MGICVIGGFIFFPPLESLMNQKPCHTRSFLFNFGGKVVFQKVNLNPKYCAGHSFRYRTAGWGLVQLYFGGIQKGTLSYSHIGHFNQKGALKKETGGTKNGNHTVDEWNWKEIRKYSRKLKYQIHQKMSVKKLGSMGMLNGASKLEKKA